LPLPAHQSLGFFCIGELFGENTWADITETIFGKKAEEIFLILKPVGKELNGLEKGPAIEKKSGKASEAAPLFAGVDSLKNTVRKVKSLTERGAEKVGGLVIAVIGQPKIRREITNTGRRCDKFFDNPREKPGLPVDPPAAKVAGDHDLVAACDKKVVKAGGDDKVSGGVGMAKGFERGVKADAHDSL